jgi:hypothetical protein
VVHNVGWRPGSAARCSVASPTTRRSRDLVACGARGGGRRGLEHHSAIQGARRAKQAPGGAVPVENRTRRAPETPPPVRRLQRSSDVLGLVNLLSGIGLVASTGLFWRNR